MRADATHFASSLFDLEPDTTYDLRLTLSDPDGVNGASVAISPPARRAN